MYGYFILHSAKKQYHKCVPSVRTVTILDMGRLTIKHLLFFVMPATSLVRHNHNNELSIGMPVNPLASAPLN